MPEQLAGTKSSDGESAVRQRLFEAATELFALHGFHATGVQALSDQVGVGPGALYHHIDSKEEILFVICIEPLERLLERATPIVALDCPARERLTLLARDLMADLAAHRLAWMVGLRELASLGPAHREAVIEARDTYEGLWLRVLEDGAANGEFVASGRLLCRGILGLLNNSHLWISSAGPIDPEVIADAYARLILDGLCVRDGVGS